MAVKRPMTIQTEQDIRALHFGARGTTTSAGNVGGTTLIDTARTEVNDFWNDHFSIKILSGANKGEVRQIIDFDAATDTVTVDRAFTAQVASSVGYLIRADPYSIQGANSADNLVDTSNTSYNIDGSLVERDESSLKAIQVVAGGGAGFEEDGSGATLYKSVVAYEGLTTSAGSTTTIVDTVLTAFAADYWNGSQVMMLENNSAGVVRTIVDFDGTSTLTLEPALPVAPSDASAYIILPGKNGDWILGDNTANNAYDSSSVTVDNDGSMLERVEGILSQCRSKGYTGDIYYVSNTGNDSWDGLTIATAFLTVDYAMTQLTTNNDDVLIILDGSYDTTVGGANGGYLNIDSAHIFGLGGGSTVIYNLNGSADYAIRINGDDNEIAGIEIYGTVNTVMGLAITGLNNTVHDMIFRGTMENGMYISSTYTEVYNCRFTGITNDGIEITTTDCFLHDNYFNQCQDNGINVVSDRNVISNNIIVGGGSTTNGINLGATADYNVLVDNSINGCTNEIADAGTFNNPYNAARAIGSNDANNPFDSSNVVADADGSVFERLEDISGVIADMGGVDAYGVVTTATSDTQVKVLGLAGKGTDVYNDRYYLHVIQADNAAPEGETRKITAYDTSDGDITVGASFSVAPDVGDQILVLHESLALMFMHADATLTSVIDDSIIAHILAIDGDVSDYDDNTMSLEALNVDLDAIIVETAATVAGRAQIATTTEDLNQAAASYDLFTGTTQDVILESLSIRLPNVDVSDDATITSISIQNDDVTPQVYVSVAEGDVLNLTAEAQLAWTGSSLIKTGTKIQLTIAGGASDAASVCDVTAKYVAAVDGGTLA